MGYFFLFLGVTFYFHCAANMDRSNLYLKMHKLVFGSVSLFAAENEQMLKVSSVLMYTDKTGKTVWGWY